jgi:hypothetical protein
VPGRPPPAAMPAAAAAGFVRRASADLYAGSRLSVLPKGVAGGAAAAAGRSTGRLTSAAVAGLRGAVAGKSSTLRARTECFGCAQLCIDFKPCGRTVARVGSLT